MFFIIPVTRIFRSLRKGAATILGEREVRSLENDAADFINEVYDDTVGDVINRIKTNGEEHKHVKMR
ncbi:MAG: hypothetical protein IJV40_00480 [Oscillospiraceae bacterium]|nr:hypothetical protein [Oscillospiraceae bacterium]